MLLYVAAQSRAGTCLQHTVFLGAAGSMKSSSMLALSHRQGLPAAWHGGARPRPRGRTLVHVARPGDNEGVVREFQSNSSLPLRAPSRNSWAGSSGSVMVPTTPSRANEAVPAPAGLRGKYTEWWDALPSHYKIILAGSMSFVICNMVSLDRGGCPCHSSWLWSAAVQITGRLFCALANSTMRHC